MDRPLLSATECDRGPFGEVLSDAPDGLALSKHTLGADGCMDSVHREIAGAFVGDGVGLILSQTRQDELCKGASSRQPPANGPAHLAHHDAVLLAADDVAQAALVAGCGPVRAADVAQGAR